MSRKRLEDQHGRNDHPPALRPGDGQEDIVISLRSDEDALPHEHEQLHRALVEKLIEGGLLKAGELGQIVVEREEGGRGGAAGQHAAAGSAPQAQGAGRMTP